MGYVEETGAARFLRDVRITPIYEGTNGIQAADLVGRKLGLEGGAVFEALIGEVLRDAEHPELRALVDACAEIGRGLQRADADDRLAASTPFLTMLSVATCGSLLERAAQSVQDDGFGLAKRVVARFYLDQIVPEALGLRAAATASAEVLYALDAEALAG